MLHFHSGVSMESSTMVSGFKTMGLRRCPSGGDHFHNELGDQGVDARSPVAGSIRGLAFYLRHIQEQ